MASAAGVAGFRASLDLGSKRMTYSVFYRRLPRSLGAPTGFALERLRDAKRVYEKTTSLSHEANRSRGSGGPGTSQLHNARSLHHLLVEISSAGPIAWVPTSIYDRFLYKFPFDGLAHQD